MMMVVPVMIRAISVTVTPGWTVYITGAKPYCNECQHNHYFVMFKPLFHPLVFLLVKNVISYYKKVLPPRSLKS